MTSQLPDTGGNGGTAADLTAAHRATFGIHGRQDLHTELDNARELVTAPETWQFADALYDAAYANTEADS